MPEKSGETNRNECSFSSVTKKTVEDVLSEVASDPEKVLLEEFSIIEDENPELLDAISVFCKSLPAPKTFLEGVLWTHRILKVQAAINGGKLLPVTKEAFLAYMGDLLEETTTGETLVEHGNGVLKRIETEEPELAAGLREVTRYRTDRGNFFSGAGIVYNIQRNIAESRRIGNDLGFCGSSW